MPRFFYLMNRRYGELSRHSEAQMRLTRREALRATLAASAGLLLSGCASFSRAKPGRRIVVVGAGLAGLSCAHELASVGYDVRVFDTRRRVGGRVLSFSDFVPGKNVEGGAELIGSNHPHWLAYAKRYGLTFLDVSEEAELEQPLVLGGRTITGKAARELWEKLKGACSGMNELASGIDAASPWDSPNSADLDSRSLRSWIERASDDDLVRRALEANLGGDNGVWTGDMSLLAMLCQVKGGGLQGFWDESEVYRCAQGNQALAYHLAAELEGRLSLGTGVRAITASNAGAAVELDDGSKVECDDVVLTVPPGAWGRIEFSPGLPEELRVQMGTCVKYLTCVRERFWKAGGRAQWTLSDADVNWTWESTDGQGDTGPFGLTGFSGGPGAKRCLDRSADERDARYAELLESWFPGFRANVTATRFMDWPHDPLVGGAYSAFAPGQVTRAGPVLHEGLGRLHFAGEHCSFAFMGYMEGALHSGVSLARRLAARDGLRVPEPELPAAHGAEAR